MQVLALAARGTHDLVARECRALGLPVERTAGDGVWMDLTPEQTAKALVGLRIASRLLLHLGGFHAEDAESLYEGAWDLDWPRWMNADATFAVHASGDLIPSTPERRGLDHHLFVSLKVKDAIADRLTRKLGRRPNVAREDPEIRVVVRGRRGRWDVFLDLADPPLHHRGHRAQPGPAPLKETLAAAVVEVVDWRGQGRLHDPTCGSGTLVIEAVNRHLGIPPGCTRWFGVERWPHHGETMQQHLDEERRKGVDHAKSAISNAKGLDVLATDLYPDAIEAVRANLIASGLDGIVRVEQLDAAKLAPPPAGTTIVCNPPYGQRLGGEGVEDLFRSLGDAWRGFSGVTAWVLEGHEGFQAAFGMADTGHQDFSNGPLPVTLRRYALGRVAKANA